MKQFLTGLATICLLFVALFSAPVFAGDTTSAVDNEAIVQTLGEDDALHCKTSFPDGTSAECWLCKCPMTQAAAIASEDQLQP